MQGHSHEFSEVQTDNQIPHGLPEGELKQIPTSESALK